MALGMTAKTALRYAMALAALPVTVIMSSEKRLPPLLTMERLTSKAVETLFSRSQQVPRLMTCLSVMLTTLASARMFPKLETMSLARWTDGPVMGLPPRGSA